MSKWLWLSVVGLLLSGCADNARQRACRVFSPAQIETPSTQEDPRIDGQSGSLPDGGMPDQRC